MWSQIDGVWHYTFIWWELVLAFLQIGGFGAVIMKLIMDNKKCKDSNENEDSK